MRLILILLMAVFMAGCVTASKRIRYDHPTAGFEQFEEENYQCLRRTSSETTGKRNAYGEVISGGVTVDCDKYNACMEKKGYTRSSEGILLTSKDLQINCK